MKQPDETVVHSLDEFFQSGQMIRYKKGECILRADDVPVGVYFLKSGNVRQYIISPTGDTFIIHVYKPGSFFPLTWIINDTPNVYNFDALTESTIVRASKEGFVALLHNNPDVLFFAAQKLAAGISGLVTRVGQLVIDEAYTKTILLLLYYADNFGKETSRGLELTVPLTHREIASWIGTTRETASLQMETLKKNGLVRMVGRKIIIPNRAQLQKEIAPVSKQV
jgi:CRP-like cAMP-binding protein